MSKSIIYGTLIRLGGSSFDDVVQAVFEVSDIVQVSIKVTDAVSDRLSEYGGLPCVIMIDGNAVDVQRDFNAPTT